MTAIMTKEEAVILTKRKTSSKVNDAEVKVYSVGCVTNKDDKEYVSRADTVFLSMCHPLPNSHPLFQL